MNKDWLSDITPIANEFKLDPKLVHAIVQVESSGNPWATRFEPIYPYLFEVSSLASQLRLTVATVSACQQMSWGLMQVMGAVAYERGFRGYPTELCLPSVGIHWGCAQLAWLRDRWGVQEMGLVSAYNQGGPYKTPGGLWKNQAYVDKVYAAFRGYS